MENTLLDNIKFMLERYGVEAELKLASGRIFIYTSNMKEALKALSFVFGIVSFSPAIEVGNEYSELVRTAVDYAKKFLEPGDRFAVRARRVKTLPYTSKDIEKDVGRSILEEVNGVSVDLEEPDKVIYVEARTNKAYIFTEVYVGPGGLPYGVEGKVVALISGGVD
ncbi:MAG: tRNA 4-thiouridine(8) synthase ThiI, partial [Thermoprotei archaeon]